MGSSRRENACTAAGDLAHFCEIVRALHEGKRDPVDILVERGDQVPVILVGHRAGGDFGIGNADALAVGQLAADNDFRHGPGAVGFQNLELDLAVIEQQAVARLESLKNFGMRQVDPVDAAAGLVGVQRERCAVFQHDRAVGEGSHAQFRSLEVGQNADRPSNFPLDRTDAFDKHLQTIMIGMAHVDAEHVRTGAIQFFDDVLF